jgi:hypothetical protein
MTNYTKPGDKGGGGGCASSDKPMPLRKTVHSCHEWIDTRLGWIHQPTDSPFMPCMDGQSADRPEHTTFDGSINIVDSPCNNYVARASHPASPGFGVALSSKTFF